MAHQHRHELMAKAADKFGRTIFKMCYNSVTESKKKRSGFNHYMFQQNVLSAGYNYWVKWHHAGKLTHKQKLTWKR